MKTYLEKAFLALSLVSFIFFILEFIPLQKEKSNSELKESFDQSLLYLNSKKKLVAHCDSAFSALSKLYSENVKDSLFADIAAVTVRERFYHKWAEFGIGNNHMALFLQPLFFKKEVTHIVDVDDILKSPAAICGQQARVLAAVLAGKNIPVRKVLFDHPDYGGHYAIEAFYQNDWHYFDVDKEINLSIVRQYNRPSVSRLLQDTSLLKKIYSPEDAELVSGYFETVQIENFKKVEGPNLLIYQKVTKVLSYMLWAVFFALFLILKRKRSSLAVKPVQALASN